MRDLVSWWNFNVRYETYKWWHDTLPSWVARRLPRRVAYYAAIRVGVHATTGDFSNQIVPELTFLDSIKRWDLRKDHKGRYIE